MNLGIIAADDVIAVKFEFGKIWIVRFKIIALDSIGPNEILLTVSDLATSVTLRY